MKNLQKKLTPCYIFSLNYWFRYVTAGEQEKDFDNVNITATSLEEAETQIMDKFNSPNCRIFKIELVNQTPTLTKNLLFNLTNPAL